jgi:hypothetical protein
MSKSSCLVLSVGCNCREAGRVAAGVGEVFYIAGPKRIAVHDKGDRNGAGSPPIRLNSASPWSNAAINSLIGGKPYKNPTL